MSFSDFTAANEVLQWEMRHIWLIKARYKRSRIIFKKTYATRFATHVIHWHMDAAKFDSTSTLAALNSRLSKYLFNRCTAIASTKSWKHYKPSKTMSGSLVRQKILKILTILTVSTLPATSAVNSARRSCHNETAFI